LLPRARMILHECNAAKSEVSHRGPVRRLQLGLLRTAPTVRLAALIGDFVKAHGDDLQISIKDGSPAQLLRWLDEGRVDIALSVRPEPQSGLFFTPLYKWKYMLAV